MNSLSGDMVTPKEKSPMKKSIIVAKAKHMVINESKHAEENEESKAVVLQIESPLKSVENYISNASQTQMLMGFD